LASLSLHLQYQRNLPEISENLYHWIPTRLVIMLYAFPGLFILYFILVTVFHLVSEDSLTDLTQRLLASIRSFVYHGVLGIICFIHAQSSIWIKAEGIQLQSDISKGEFPGDGWQRIKKDETAILKRKWERIKKYDIAIRKHNKYSGNVVSIALLFYFAAAASSCISLGMYNGWHQILLFFLIGCAGLVILMTTYFSALITSQSKYIPKPLSFIVPGSHFRLQYSKLESEIGGFAVSMTIIKRSLVGLGMFVFMLIPFADWLSK